MMNKRWTALLGCVAVGAAALADGIVIGRLENGGVDVAAGETETVTSPLEISAGGAFIKRGAGTLNFPVAAVETVSNRVSYQVLAGTLNVTEDPVTAPALAVPSCVTEKAAAWFSAIDGDFITTDGGGNVVNWYDARETGVTDPGFTPTRRYMAYACVDGKAGCPQAKKDVVPRPQRRLFRRLRGPKQGRLHAADEDGRYEGRPGVRVECLLRAWRS